MSAYNNTTARNYTSRYQDLDWDALNYSYYFLYGLLLAVGTPLNVWMLGSIITSPEIRSYFRNKLICLLLFNNFLKCTVAGGTELFHLISIYQAGVKWNCVLHTFTFVIKMLVVVIENWYFIVFLIQYIAILLDFDPYRRATPRVIQIGTIVLLAFPWIFSIVVTPTILTYHSHKRYGVHSKGCIYFTLTSYRFTKMFGIVVPCFIKVALLAGIAVLYFRGEKQGRRMTSSRIGTATEIDDVKAYVISGVVSFVTQIFYVIPFLSRLQFAGFVEMIAYYYFAWMLVEYRAIFLPLCFLALPDIRSRMKTWRPWYRPAPGIDLTVHYNSKNDN